MKTIGITGGVGAGKSTVLNFIRDNYSAEVILADDLAKDLCLKGQACYEPLIGLLGSDCLDDKLEIDRAKMADRIFKDESLVKKVNGIVHPAVKQYIIDRIAYHREKNDIDYFFLEAALLIDDGYKEILDELWYIYADVETRRKRLKESRHYSDEKIDNIMSNQLTEDEFRKNCDFVIDNSFTPEESIKAIKERMENG